MEIYKNINGFNDYSINKEGVVLSHKNKKTKILKQILGNDGYLFVCLYGENGMCTKKVHKLVAESFLNHVPCGHKLVVNHKDFNRLNNNIKNLEIVTTRENTNRKHIKSKSIFVGVSWHESCSKWRAGIKINGIRKHLGLFENEIDAHNAYQNELKRINTI